LVRAKPFFVGAASQSTNTNGDIHQFTSVNGAIKSVSTITMPTIGGITRLYTVFGWSRRTWWGSAFSVKKKSRTPDLRQRICCLISAVDLGCLDRKLSSYFFAPFISSCLSQFFTEEFRARIA